MSPISSPRFSFTTLEKKMYHHHNCDSQEEAGERKSSLGDNNKHQSTAPTAPSSAMTLTPAPTGARAAYALPLSSSPMMKITSTPKHTHGILPPQSTSTMQQQRLCQSRLPIVSPSESITSTTPTTTSQILSKFYTYHPNRESVYAAERSIVAKRAALSSPPMLPSFIQLDDAIDTCNSNHTNGDDHNRDNHKNNNNESGSDVNVHNVMAGTPFKKRKHVLTHQQHQHQWHTKRGRFIGPSPSTVTDIMNHYDDHNNDDDDDDVIVSCPLPSPPLLRDININNISSLVHRPNDITDRTSTTTSAFSKYQHSDHHHYNENNDNEILQAAGILCNIRHNNHDENTANKNDLHYHHDQLSLNISSSILYSMKKSKKKEDLCTTRRRHVTKNNKINTTIAFQERNNNSVAISPIPNADVTAKTFDDIFNLNRLTKYGSNEENDANKDGVVIDDIALYPECNDQVMITSIHDKQNQVHNNKNNMKNNNNKVKLPTRLALPRDQFEVNSLHCYVRAELLELFVVPSKKIDLYGSNRNNKSNNKNNSVQKRGIMDEKDIATLATRKTRSRQSNCASTDVVTTMVSSSKSKSLGQGATNRRHIPGRVGLRCVHCKTYQMNRALCKKLSSIDATKADFYPKSVEQLYREVCTWQRVHFQHCPYVSQECRDKYRHLKESDKTRGKTKYWEASAKEIGLVNACNISGENDGVCFNNEHVRA